MQTQQQSPEDQRIPTLLTLNIAPPLTNPPVLDGVLNDTCWEASAETSHFYDAECGTPRRARSQTVVKAGYDTKGIYLAIRCHDDRMNLVHG